MARTRLKKWVPFAIGGLVVLGAGLVKKLVRDKRYKKIKAQRLRM